MVFQVGAVQVIEEEELARLVGVLAEPLFEHVDEQIARFQLAFGELAVLNEMLLLLPRQRGDSEISVFRAKFEAFFLGLAGPLAGPLAGSFVRTF